jgi:hypothetical protein
VAWFVAAFAALSWCLLAVNPKRKEAIVLASWLVAALLPGILSTYANPKREATLYAAVDCGVALLIALMFHHAKTSLGPKGAMAAKALLAVALVIYTCGTASAWFSGRQWRYGIPHDVAVADAIRKKLEPNTIVIAETLNDYSPGKLLFLLLDDFYSEKNRPIVIYFVHRDPGTLKDYVMNPRKALGSFDTDGFPYVWTELHDRIGEIKAAKDWKRVLYVFEDPSRIFKEYGMKHIEYAQRLCPKGSWTTVPWGGMVESNFFIGSCPLPAGG